MQTRYVIRANDGTHLSLHKPIRKINRTVQQMNDASSDENKTTQHP